jgi:hypothetical protein
MPFVKRVNTPEAEAALAELRSTGGQYERARKRLEEVARRRDEQIRKASALGATRRDVAAAARLTAAAVQKILGARRDSRP